MKKIMLIIMLSLLFLTACKQEQSQIANPASVYCENQGGKVEMVNNPDGVQGICILKNGTRCDEWAYYRGECPK
jgi:hypothetical protein